MSTPDQKNRKDEAAGAAQRTANDQQGDQTVGGPAHARAPENGTGSAAAFIKRLAESYGGGEAKEGIEGLREEAAGGLLGGPDPQRLLELYEGLSGGERGELAGDSALLQSVLGAMTTQEATIVVLTLGMELKWSIHWLDQTGHLDSIAPGILIALFHRAPPQQLLEYVGWTELFAGTHLRLRSKPKTLFIRLLGTDEWLHALSTSIHLMRWTLTTCPLDEMFEELFVGPRDAALRWRLWRKVGQAFGLDAFLLSLGFDGALDDDQVAVLCYDHALMEWVCAHQPAEQLLVLFFGGARAVDAQKKLIRGIARGPGWSGFLGGMPSGAGLSGDGRRTLRALFDVARLGLGKQLFEQNFGAPAEMGDKEVKGADGNKTDEVKFTDWTQESLAAVWDQLALLPPGHVSGGEIVTAYKATHGGGGSFGMSSHQELRVGVDRKPEKIGRTVRHEVGHAVHASNRAAVDAWLEGTMGFETLASNAFKASSSLIRKFGGFPTEFEFGGEELEVKGSHRTMLDMEFATWIGGNKGNYAPPREDVAKDPSSETAALWKAMDPALHGVVKASRKNHYTNWRNFHVDGGKRYFINHYHASACCFDTSLDSIIASIRDYASADNKEFFAELYATYFADPAGALDPSVWGDGLPTTVTSFFEKEMGAAPLARHPLMRPS